MVNKTKETEVNKGIGKINSYFSIVETRQPKKKYKKTTDYREKKHTHKKQIFHTTQNTKLPKPLKKY